MSANQQQAASTYLVASDAGTPVSGAGPLADYIMAVAAAGAGRDSAEAATDRLASSIGDYQSNAGQTGKVLLAVEAMGRDGTNFGGVNLIEKTQSFEQDGAYNRSTFSNALALIALGRANAASKDSLTTWEDAQCSDGGYAFSVTPSEAACTNSASVDSTALAVQAFIANGYAADESHVQRALKFLHEKTFAGTPNANTVGLAAGAFAAAGDTDYLTKAQDWLAQVQFDCTFPVVERGGFGYKTKANDNKSFMATVQAAIGFAGRSYADVSINGASLNPVWLNCEDNPAPQAPVPSTVTSTVPTTTATTTATATTTTTVPTTTTATTTTTVDKLVTTTVREPVPTTLSTTLTSYIAPGEENPTITATVTEPIPTTIMETVPTTVTETVEKPVPTTVTETVEKPVPTTKVKVVPTTATSTVENTVTTTATTTVEKTVPAEPTARNGLADAARTCIDAGNVWVVVDSATTVDGGCATEFDTGFAALASAGFTDTEFAFDGSFLAAINSVKPDFASDGTYWSYWQGEVATDGRVTYTFSDLGGGQTHPAPGSIDAWRVGTGDELPGLPVVPPATTQPDPTTVVSTVVTTVEKPVDRPVPTTVTVTATPAAGADDSSSSNTSSEPLDAGAKAGISIGVIAVLAALVAALVQVAPSLGIRLPGLPL
ncbi:MAG: hypothetical protein SPI77_06180 [Corynebacterium sp.]|nr:hypothetical protein [Corynebacterium sp.]